MLPDFSQSADDNDRDHRGPMLLRRYWILDWCKVSTNVLDFLMTLISFLSMLQESSYS